MTTTLLADLGWDDDWDDHWDDHWAADLASLGHQLLVDPDDRRPARVARVDRSGYDLLAAGGPARATASGAILAAAAVSSTAPPCVGDWVVLMSWPDGRTTVEAVLPRRTAIVRATAGATSQGQVLAANVDLAVVVEPLHPEPDLGRVERLLALAWQSGARPVVVLTKADLVPDAEHVATDVAAAAPGVDVLVVSCTTGLGVDRLRALVRPGTTLGLLGASGAGKSTLTNELAGTAVMTTRALRADGKGRHTTAHRELVLLPGGGVVIDTPGLRQVGLFDAVEGIDKVFDDVEQLTRRCRFNDCGHHSEPGCEVIAAIERGDLDPRRLESWRKLQREALRMAMRSDARLRQAEVSRWKRLTREHRTTDARRGRDRT